MSPLSVYCQFFCNFRLNNASYCKIDTDRLKVKTRPKTQIISDLASLCRLMQESARGGT